MESNQQIALFTEITSEESATVSGGQTAIANVTVVFPGVIPITPTPATTTTQGTRVNFDLNSYLFTIGAGAVFNGGVTTNVVNIAFGKALS